MDGDTSSFFGGEFSAEECCPEQKQPFGIGVSCVCLGATNIAEVFIAPNALSGCL